MFKWTGELDSLYINDGGRELITCFRSAFVNYKVRRRPKYKPEDSLISLVAA
jgi:hypothetical protein